MPTVQSDHRKGCWRNNRRL